MGRVSGRLSGTGRRGTAAGLFAVLLVAMAPVMTAAFGDGEPDPGTAGQIPPAVPIEAPALPQQPPAAATPPADSPPIVIPPADPPPIETPPVETPPVETPPVETPPVEAPPVETPPAETPPVEAPPVETPPAETQPVAEAPAPAEAPAADPEPASSPAADPQPIAGKAHAFGDPTVLGRPAGPAATPPADLDPTPPIVVAGDAPSTVGGTIDGKADAPAGLPGTARTNLTPFQRARAKVKAQARARKRERAELLRTVLSNTVRVVPAAQTAAPAATAPTSPASGGGGAEAPAADPVAVLHRDAKRLHSKGLRLVPLVFGALSGTVAVIPAAVWGALGALALLAALMFGFAVARDRRARGLERERESLIADLVALEGAVVPALPEALGGLALSVTSAPAAGPISGGDFHDAFALSRDRVAVLVGDVAGHGRQALADAQLVRHAVRAYLEAGLDPRSALAMTGAVVEEREDPLFASVVVAVHDRRDGTLTFASAGHEPPVFVTEQGAGLPPVTGWSPPLGTGLETGRRQTTIPLPQGSAVCLITDGVIEARSDGMRIGATRLIKWLSALGPGATSSDVVDRLHEAADVTDDDVTVCMLRALTPAATGAARIEEAIVEGGDPTYLVRFLRDCGLPVADAEEAGAALEAAPDGTRMVASVEIRGGRAIVELAPLRGSSYSHLVGQG